MLRILLGLLLFTLPVAASAEWHEASSDHFLVIADQNEKDVREFTERLERFHSALLSFMNNRGDEAKPSPSNRITIYVVRSSNQVRKLAGDKTGYVQGFYQARAGGSVAFTSRVDSQGTNFSDSEQVLLHEYAHHVMHGASEWATPRWLSEGFAEFFSTARFGGDGGVALGLPADHRAAELFFARDVPIEALLDSEVYKKRKTRAYDEFYGRSWLLYHYLTLSGNRKGQLITYLTALANGAAEGDAARKAFGDLAVLDDELDRYLRQSKMRYMPMPPEKLKVGQINVRKMNAAEAAIMPVVLESKRGVNAETAKLVLPRAQAIAARFPDDPAVLAALAEAEHDAGNHAAAIATADKALLKSPTRVNAHVQKIYALTRIAENSAEPAAAWKAVRKAATTLNAIEPDHPTPLFYYYRSLQASGKEISENAKHGLERALQLAPYDQELRWQTVQQMMADESYALAYRTLMPLANDPHNRGEDNRAIPLLAEIKGKLEAKIAEQGAATNKDTAAAPAADAKSP
jgi:tetratricopeptide (TPR) repeat protein